MKLPTSRSGLSLLITWVLFFCSAPALAIDRALLVGVTEYPFLPGKRLAGPANDLRLMSRTLTRLGWQSAHIQVLSEDGGPTSWPTRANILSGLEQLALQAKAGDWIVVYLSGHGSQVPQSVQTRAKYLEPDDLDEVFLPRDTSAWDPDKRIVVGAISDDEINAALTKITSKGANVWAIFDTCHAGDMLRKGDPLSADNLAVWRYVTATELKVPPEEMSKSRLNEHRRFGVPVQAQRSTHQRLLANMSQRWVGFFASQANEGAAEESLPDPDQPQRKQRFGVFTHLIHQSIGEWKGSFEELAAHLKLGYRDRPFPTPEFSGQLHVVPRFSNPSGRSVSQAATK